jgi:hypothetical protein
LQLFLTPAINYRPCHCYWRKIIASRFYWCLIIVGVLVTDDKLIAGVMESMKIKNKASSPTTPAILIKGNNNTGDNLSPEITTSVSLTLVNNL